MSDTRTATARATVAVAVGFVLVQRQGQGDGRDANKKQIMRGGDGRAGRRGGAPVKHEPC